MCSKQKSLESKGLDLRSQAQDFLQCHVLSSPILFPTVIKAPLNSQTPCFFPLRPDEIFSVTDTFFV